MSNNHIQLAQKIVEDWPEWKQQAVKSAVDAHKLPEEAEEAEIIQLFPLAPSSKQK